MAINQLIAQGIRPIGADVPQIGNMLLQKRDMEQRNALAQREAAIAEQNAAQYQRANDLTAQRQQQALTAAEQQEMRAFVQNGIANLEAVSADPAQFAQVADAIAADPRSARLGISREQITPEAIARLRVQAQMAPPETAAPIEQQRIGGYTVLTQGGKPLPGSVQAPQRVATGGPVGGKFGAPREGVNPETGRVEFFVTDNAGNVRWLGASGAAGANTTARETAKDQVKASSEIGQVTANASDMLNVLGKLERSPLGLVYGAASMAPTVPGTRQADAIALWEQVQGKAFLEAFATLKGGGQITEIEGKKATAAITRLSNRAQSPKAAREAIRELREVVTAGVVRARRKAEGGQQSEPSGNVVDFNDL